MMIPGYFNFPFKEVRQVSADKQLMKRTVQRIIENKRQVIKDNSGVCTVEVLRTVSKIICKVITILVRMPSLISNVFECRDLRVNVNELTFQDPDQDPNHN